MKNKNTKYPLVYIEWEDAAVSKEEWQTLEDALEFSEEHNSIIRQSAFLLKEEKRSITLASRVCQENENEAVFSSVLKIPKTWIRKRIDLSEFIK